jgi:hypothetical protein
MTRSLCYHGVVTYACRIAELALSILKEDLHIQDEHSHSSTPTVAFVPDISRECARRAFWYIRLMHLTTFAYFEIPAPPITMDLNLPLPVDEASFEFGTFNSPLGSFHHPPSSRCDQCLMFERYPVEYLHLPAPRTQYASEYGHLLRIASVHGHLEAALNATDGKPFPITYAHVEHLISLPRRSRSPA